MLSHGARLSFDVRRPSSFDRSGTVHIKLAGRATRLPVSTIGAIVVHSLAYTLGVHAALASSGVNRASVGTEPHWSIITEMLYYSCGVHPIHEVHLPTTRDDKDQ